MAGAEVIVVVLRPIEGVSLWGPFDQENEALAWALTHDCDFWLVEVQPLTEAA